MKADIVMLNDSQNRRRRTQRVLAPSPIRLASTCRRCRFSEQYDDEVLHKCRFRFFVLLGARR